MQKKIVSGKIRIEGLGFVPFFAELSARNTWLSLISSSYPIFFIFHFVPIEILRNPDNWLNTEISLNTTQYLREYLQGRNSACHDYGIWSLDRKSGNRQESYMCILLESMAAEQFPVFVQTDQGFVPDFLRTVIDKLMTCDTVRLYTPSILTITLHVWF